MKLTWLLVADSSRARIFNIKKGNLLEELEDIYHPEGRLHEQQLTSDLPGKDSDKCGAGKHSFQDQVEPKQQEAIEFAKHIAKHLDKSRSIEAFEQLVVIAAPSFLGTLRQQFTDEINRKICFELSKNITSHDTDEIRQHLPAHIPNSLT